MSDRARPLVLALAFLMLAPAVWRVASALPPFGAPTSLYGVAVNALLPRMRHVTNMIAAVNFDVRGIDTLGEEMMLLAATTGATVLLRGSRGEGVSDRAAVLPGRAALPRADAVALVSRFGGTALMLYALYLIVHGTLTPGGGFQGGVICATAMLLVYLGEGYPAWRRVAPAPVLHAMEGGGGLVYALAALLPLAFGRPALANLLSFGTWKDPYSGGTMVLLNLAVGFAVTGSFGMLLLEFLEETREPESHAEEAEGE